MYGSFGDTRRKDYKGDDTMTKKTDQLKVVISMV
jgi:hypothetical protein